MNSGGVAPPQTSEVVHYFNGTPSIGVSLNPPAQQEGTLFDRTRSISETNDALPIENDTVWVLNGVLGCVPPLSNWLLTVVSQYPNVQVPLNGYGQSGQGGGFTSLPQGHQLITATPMEDSPLQCFHRACARQVIKSHRRSAHLRSQDATLPGIRMLCGVALDHMKGAPGGTAGRRRPSPTWPRCLFGTKKLASKIPVARGIKNK